MRTSLLLLPILALAIGCSAPTSSEDEADSANSDVVGIGDYATIASALGLTNATAAAPTNLTALRAGDCYKALKANPGYPEFEFRGYTNGAIFWAKKDSGYNSGDSRPILCADMHQGDKAVRSLSGVALDAVIRYNLGKPVGGDTATSIPFERGTIVLKPMAEADRFAAAKKRPHELDMANPATISGSLDKITIKKVTITSIYNPGPEIRDFDMKGSAAFLVFRYAWRKAEDGSAFTIATDAVGKFKGTTDVLGDGPGYGETWQFEKGNGIYATMFDYERSITQENVSFQKRAAAGQRGSSAPPLAECSRDQVYVENVPDDRQPAPGPFHCTGI